MFCNNCGKPIDDDRSLCEQCENAAANKAINESLLFDKQMEDNCADETDTYAYDNDVPYADYALNDAAKAKKSGIVRSIAIAAAVIGVLAVLLVVFWKPIVGLFDPSLRFDTPQEHFSFVEREAADAFASGITASYEKAIAGNEENDHAGQYETHILLGDQALDLLGSYLFDEGAGVDISWLSDILIDIDATGEEGLLQAVVALGLGENKILSADLIVDAGKQVLWAAIPELSNQYLEFDLDALSESYYGEGIEESGLIANNNSQYLSVLPSDQVVHQLAMKYIDIVLEKITDVQSAKQTLTVESMTQECTALTATIPEKTLIEISISVMETLKQDEVVLGVMGDLAELSGEDADAVKKDFIEQIDTSIVDLQNALAEAKDTNYLQWVDYVENGTNIIGRRITISDSEQEFYYLKLKEEDQFVFEAKILDSLDIVGTGSETRNVVNASYDLKVEGNEYCSIDVVDFDCNKLEYGQFSGKILLEPCGAMYEELLGVNLELDLVFEILLDTKEQEVDFELNALLDNQLFAGITFDGMKTDGKAVTQPTKGLDPNDDVQLTQWLQSFDFDVFVSNLKKTNMPGELIDAIEEYCQLLVQSLEGY